MCNSKKHPIREEWTNYYQVLEAIRRTGAVNMWGAAPYLKEFCTELTEEESRDILLSWIENYTELSQQFCWRD